MRPDDALRRPEFHSGQAGRPPDQRFGGNSESERDGPAPVFPLRGHHIEGERGTRVQHDGGDSVEVMDGHRIRDPVRAGLLGGVHRQANPAGGLVVQHEERAPEMTLGQGAQDFGRRGNHARRREPANVRPRNPGSGKQAVEQRRHLVGQPLGLGGNPPVADPAFAVVEADGGLGVADVENEEHGYPLAACGGTRVSAEPGSSPGGGEAPG